MKLPLAFDADEVLFLRKPEARAALPIPTLRGSDWAKEGIRSVRAHQPLGGVEWCIECYLHGIRTLESVIEIDPGKRGGIPVLVGTRFTVAQVLAELAETQGVEEVAATYRLDAEAIRGLLDGMSLLMQKPMIAK